MVRRELSAEAPGGWILLEILVAVVMLALILGPLTTGMIGILGREVRAERQADIMSSRDLPGEQAWTWGDRAIQAGWSSGPSLRIRVAGNEAPPEMLIGIWADGWLIGEMQPADNGELFLDGSAWEGRAGQELVVRVREGDGGWGPPWRTMVPAAIAPETAMKDSSALLAEATGEVVIHSATAANPAVRMLATGTEALPGPSGFPFFAGSIAPGIAGLESDGAVQSWCSESGRSLDVYF